jgi:hypothetical protein
MQSSLGSADLWVAGCATRLIDQGTNLSSYVAERGAY